MARVTRGASTPTYHRYLKIYNMAWIDKDRKPQARQIRKACRSVIIETLIKDFRVATLHRVYVEEFVDNFINSTDTFVNDTATPFIDKWNRYSFEKQIGLYSCIPKEEEQLDEPFNN